MVDIDTRSIVGAEKKTTFGGWEPKGKSFYRYHLVSSYGTMERMA